jgi:hypothetical protein
MPKMPTLPPPMARLPKEPSPDMVRSFGPRPTLENVPALTDGAPIASPSPSAYREKNPYQAPPTEYKAPSLLREHRRLAILFAGVAAAFAVYCLKLPHGARSAGPAAAAITSSAAVSAGAAAANLTSAAPSGASVPLAAAVSPPTVSSSARSASEPPSTVQPSSATQPIYVESVTESVPEKNSH